VLAEFVCDLNLAIGSTPRYRHVDYVDNCLQHGLTIRISMASGVTIAAHSADPFLGKQTTCYPRQQGEVCQETLRASLLFFFRMALIHLVKDAPTGTPGWTTTMAVELTKSAMQQFDTEHKVGIRLHPNDITILNGGFAIQW
jgi:hypothetical protein